MYSASTCENFQFTLVVARGMAFGVLSSLELQIKNRLIRGNKTKLQQSIAGFNNSKPHVAGCQSQSSAAEAHRVICATSTYI